MAQSVVIDRLGRVVLPKALRDRYALVGGAELELTDTGSGILLIPRRARTAVKRLKNGFPVLSLAGRTDADLVSLIERTRGERDAGVRAGRGSDA